MFLTKHTGAIVSQPPRLSSAGDARSLRTDSGFTLLEMLVVLGISALALGLSTVALRGPDGPKRLRILTLNLAADLRLARANAVLLHRPVAVVVVPKENAYRVDERGTPIQLPSSVALAVHSGARGSTGARSGSITFYADGSSSGGNVTLTEGAASTRIAVEWLTGGITVAGPTP